MTRLSRILRKYLWENYEYLCRFFEQRLPQYPVLPLEGTYLVWIDCRASSIGSDAMTLRLQEGQKLMVNSGTLYGPGELNDKTQIFPLRNGLDFLGFHSYLTDTGKVVRKLRRASRERMKRKLRKYKVMYESGAITKEKITESYQSWRSHASHGDCHALIQKYDQLYNEIFERSETADVSINQRPAR